MSSDVTITIYPNVMHAKMQCQSDGEVPTQQLQCLSEVKTWIQTEAKFYGRTDDSFLLMFLRSCHFDVTLTKETLKRYYENRRDIPQWWANRNALEENIYFLLQLKIGRAVIDRDEHQPAVFIISTSRFGDNQNNFNNYMKMFAICTECVVIRHSCQKNGLILIFDCQNYKWWSLWQTISPTFIKNYISSFYKGLPIDFKAIIMINMPIIAPTTLQLLRHFVPQGSKLHCLGSDLSKLGDYVPMEIMPKEYGGDAGPLEQHDEEFVREVLAFNDYLLDDNKYGFQS